MKFNVCAVFVIFIKNNKVLLQKRFNTGYNDGLYDLISGHVENKETFKQSAVREVKEECGLLVKEENLDFQCIMHRRADDHYYDTVDVYFKALKWTGTPKINEPDKCDNLEWFSLKKLPKNMCPYVKEVLENLDKNYLEYM